MKSWVLKSTVFILFAHTTVLSQTTRNQDSLLYILSIQHTAGLVLAPQSVINYGFEYNFNKYNLLNDHQFYLTSDKVSGSIKYHNIFFDNIYLWYDIVDDELILENSKGYPISLVNDFISEFTLQQRVFRKFAVTGTIQKANDFFEVLVDGKNLKLIAKRSKLLKGNSNHNNWKMVKSFVEKRDKYFILKDGGYFPVKHLKDIAKLTNDKISLNDFKKLHSKEARLVAISNEINQRQQ